MPLKLFPQLLPLDKASRHGSESLHAFSTLLTHCRRLAHYPHPRPDCLFLEVYNPYGREQYTGMLFLISCPLFCFAVSMKEFGGLMR